jgi:hypothetical protein
MLQSEEQPIPDTFAIPGKDGLIMIRIACAVCGTVETVADDFAGRSTNCRQCGETLNVPATSGADQPQPAPLVPVRPLSRPQTQVRRKLPFLIRYGFSIALVLLFALILLVGALSPEGDKSRDSMFAFVANTTSQSKSPLMVLGVKGGWRYFTETDRNKLGVFEQPLVFGVCLCITLLVGFKDTILTFLGPLKLPLNALAALTHFLGGMLGFADVVIEGCGLMANQHGDSVSTGVVHETIAGVVVLMSFFVYVVVFLMFNVIEAILVVNPVPLVDTGLKSFRSTLVGGISALTAIHPLLGFLASMVVFLIALRAVHFSIRCTILSFVYSLGILCRPFGRVASGELNDLRAFSFWNLADVPLFTYGRFQISPDGVLNFVYKRLFLFWDRTIPLTNEGLSVATGTMNPYLVGQVGEHPDRVLLLFSPRACGSEEQICRSLHLGRVTDISWLKSINNSFFFLYTIVKEAFAF